MRPTSSLHRLLAAGVLVLALVGCGVERPEADEAGRLVEAAAPAAGRSAAAGLDSARIAEALARAAELPRLRSVLVAHHGTIRAERYFHGAGPDRTANVKSASKSIVSALVGIAIAEGHLEGVDHPISAFFPDYLAGDDPRKGEITLGHLLSMQSGLESTSGRGYGAWVQSRDWVRHALARPLVAAPGGPMIYSTGNTHLLSAILTRATGMSTLAYARSRLAGPLGIELPAWTRDPQGIYFGGNEMGLTPRALVRFGELYRNGGRWEGRQVVPEDWIRASWMPRTRSPWSGEQYGYGWFVGRAGAHPMYYAWGFGGQYVFVIPDLALTVVFTSDPTAPSRQDGHRSRLFDILNGLIVPAAETDA